MTFGEHVFQYCERGTDAALWAEPINAVSNAGFFLAALIFWQLVLWRPREERSPDHYLFVALVFLIGCGSLAFHLYANEGTELADVIPISLFMLVYLGFALNRFLSVPPGWTVLLVAIFTALVAVSMRVDCWDGGIGWQSAVEGAKPCLNGSMSYLPALGALIIVGMVAAERRHRAAPYLLWAAVVFTVSIVLRSLDFALCDQIEIDGRDVGTHFVWHLLNAVVLFLLLRASLETKTRELAAVEAEPSPTPVRTPVEATLAKKELDESPAVASAGEDAAVKVALSEPKPKDEASEAEPEPAEKAEPEPEAESAQEPDPPEPKDEKPEAQDGPGKAPAEDAPKEELEEEPSEAPAPKTGRGRKKPTA